MSTPEAPNVTTQRGPDIVERAADIEEGALSPLLIIDTITDYLDAQGIGSGQLHVERIGLGQSNVTFRIQREGADVVLRRGPRPPLPKSTHDMVREAGIQMALAPHDVPVPKIRAICDDHDLLGVPFYVMEYLDGEVITESIPPALAGEPARRAVTEGLVDSLVKLHSIDVSAGAIAQIGRPDGYLERQISRFANLWQVNTTRSLPEVDRLGTWLAENRPETQRHAVVHGDYRLGNLMFSPQADAEVLAILDWEMATLGDPLADLGYLTATYADAAAKPNAMELTPVTRLPGFLRRSELVERYRERLDIDVSALPWYQTLALWKAAIFSEAIYTRWLRGESPGSGTFAESLGVGVPELLEAAAVFAAELQ